MQVRFWQLLSMLGTHWAAYTHAHRERQSSICNEPIHFAQLTKLLAYCKLAVPSCAVADGKGKATAQGSHSTEQQHIVLTAQAQASMQQVAKATSLESQHPSAVHGSTMGPVPGQQQPMQATSPCEHSCAAGASMAEAIVSGANTGRDQSIDSSMPGDGQLQLTPQEHHSGSGSDSNGGGGGGGEGEGADDSWITEYLLGPLQEYKGADADADACGAGPAPHPAQPAGAPSKHLDLEVQGTRDSTAQSARAAEAPNAAGTGTFATDVPLSAFLQLGYQPPNMVGAGNGVDLASSGPEHAWNAHGTQQAQHTQRTQQLSDVRAQAKALRSAAVSAWHAAKAPEWLASMPTAPQGPVPLSAPSVPKRH